MRQLLKNNGNDLKIQVLAVGALHSACEDYVTDLLEMSNLAALHGNRVTILPRDLQLVRRIRGELCIRQ